MALGEQTLERWRRVGEGHPDTRMTSGWSESLIKEPQFAVVMLRSHSPIWDFLIGRRHGREADARTALVAKQRGMRSTLAVPARDVESCAGRGRRLRISPTAGRMAPDLPPGRLLHALQHLASHYSLDLLLPLVDLSQERVHSSFGAMQWIAVVLIATGWLLATTAAAGAGRFHEEAESPLRLTRGSLSSVQGQVLHSPRLGQPTVKSAALVSSVVSPSLAVARTATCHRPRGEVSASSRVTATL